MFTREHPANRTQPACCPGPRRRVGHFGRRFGSPPAVLPRRLPLVPERQSRPLVPPQRSGLGVRRGEPSPQAALALIVELVAVVVILASFLPASDGKNHSVINPQVASLLAVTVIAIGVRRQRALGAQGVQQCRRTDHYLCCDVPGWSHHCTRRRSRSSGDLDQGLLVHACEPFDRDRRFGDVDQRRRRRSQHRVRRPQLRQF